MNSDVNRCAAGCVQVIFCVQVILAGSKVGKLFFIDRRGQENHV